MNSEEILIYDFLKIAVVRFIKYLLRWKKMFAVFIFLGVLTGSLFYFFTKDNYKAKLLARSYSGYYYEINENIKELDLLRSNPQKLSKVLNISLLEAKGVKGIHSDTIDNQVIVVELKYKGDLNLNEVEAGIVRYIDNNPFFSEAIELNRINLLNLRDELISEVKELDSLQNIILTNLTNENSVNKNEKLVINNKEVNFYQNDILDRKKELFLTNKHLKELSALKIIKPITQVEVNYYSLKNVLFVSVFLFLGLGILLSLFLDIKKILD